MGKLCNAFIQVHHLKAQDDFKPTTYLFYVNIINQLMLFLFKFFFSFFSSFHQNHLFAHLLFESP